MTTLLQLGVYIYLYKKTPNYRYIYTSPISIYIYIYLTIILRGRAGYRMIDNQRGAVVLGSEVADGMVKTTPKQLEKRFNSVYMASNFYLNTEPQRVQVNQCQLCVL